MQNLFIKIRCVSWEKIIFQLLSCLYLYDSGIPVPVCIRKQSRSTDFWRRREVCAKSVDRLLASKVVRIDYLRFEPRTVSLRNQEHTTLLSYQTKQKNEIVNLLESHLNYITKFNL